MVFLLVSHRLLQSFWSGNHARGVEDMVLRHKLLPTEEIGLKAGLVARIVKESLSLLLQTGRRFTKN